MKLEVEIKLTPRQLAEAFCDLDDEQQADFFIEAARIAASWRDGAVMQWWYVGRHLRTCTCSTEEAREMVRELASALEFEPKGEG